MILGSFRRTRRKSADSHAPDLAGSIFQKYPEAQRAPDQLVTLVSQAGELAAREGAHSEEPLDILVHEIGCASADDIQAATVNLLAQSPQETDASPDPVFAQWVTAVSRNNPQILVDTLVGQQINDEQAVRLYHRISENLDQFTESHFITILQQTLPVPDGREKTADAVVRSLTEVATHMFSTDGQKRALCEAVLSVFSELPKQDRKAELARICTGLGLKNVVVDGGYKQSMPEDDMEIIEKFTGKIPT